MILHDISNPSTYILRSSTLLICIDIRISILYVVDRIRMLIFHQYQLTTCKPITITSAIQ